MKLDLQRIPLVVMFSPMLEVLRWRSLGHSINSDQGRTYFIVDHVALFP